MIRQIITDQFILSQKSTLATKEDLPIVQDLLDTIKAHETHCVGMAAEMIEPYLHNSKHTLVWCAFYYAKFQYIVILSPSISIRSIRVSIINLIVSFSPSFII